MPNYSPSTDNFPGKRDASTDARAKQCYELRLQYLSFAEIAQQVGYPTAMGAWHAYKRHVKRSLPPQDVQEMRVEMRSQIERALRALNRAIELGDTDAIKAAVLAQARIAALFGLDTPPSPAVGTQNVTRKYIIVHKTADAVALPEEAVASNGHSHAGVN